MQISSWCLNSGSTSYTYNDKTLFTEFHLNENSTIQSVVDKSAKVTGVGKVLIIGPSETSKTWLTLNKVLCIQELKCN